MASSRSYGSYPTAIMTPPQFSSSLPSSSLPDGGPHPTMDLSSITHPTLLNCIAYSYNPSSDCDPHAEDDDPDDDDDEADGNATIFGDVQADDDRRHHGGRDRDDATHSDVFSHSDDEEMMMDMDMELDDANTEKEKKVKRDTARSDRERERRESMLDVMGNRDRGNGGLLWSVNYFFYSK
jgi:hypothetical protein